jgi:hypothetical protein
MRLPLIDGFRGFFLLFMMVTHAQGVLFAPWVVFNHHHFGWVEDAQGFVFLSGLVVAMVYGRRMLQQGEGAMRTAILSRVALIWRHHAGLVLLFLAAALALPRLGLGTDLLAEQMAEPLAFTLASLGLVTGTPHMGILPMYVWLMLATPLILRAFRNGQAAVVAALSATLWFLAQTALPDQAELPIEAVLAQAGSPINIGLYFNVLAWQVLYVTGLWFGWQVADRRLDLSWLRTPVAAQVFRVMLVLWVLLGAFDVLFYTRAMPDDYDNWVFPTIDRGNLDTVYLVAAANALYLVAWLVIAGPIAGPVARAVSAGLVRVVTLPPLVHLGRHSLTVFCTHVVLVYSLSVVMQGVDPQSIPDLWRNLALYAMTLPLFAVAWLRERGLRAPQVKPA